MEQQTQQETRGFAFKDAALIVGAGIFLVLGYILMQFFLPYGYLDEPVEIEIVRGTSFRGAINRMEEGGLVRDPNVLVAMGRLTGLHTKLVPGIYSFEGSLTPMSVFRTINEGKVKLWEVTILEGLMLPHIRDLLAKDSLVSTEDFDRLVRDKDFLKSLNIKAPSLEGYIFPDTYRYEKGLSAKYILTSMVKRTFRVFTPAYRERAKELGFTINDVLTFASIVEKEALLDEERSLISAVYHNRLKKRMRLQADPTVLYGVRSLATRVRYKDLKRKTPYNTYTFYGLPPGPIAAPGQASIEAALYPADVPYTYFVSNYDGSHTFTTNFREHRKAAKIFKQKRAADIKKMKENR